MAELSPHSADFTARYYTVKHSWRGKYKRIFCIGPKCVATINPNGSWEMTNVFPYGSDLTDMTPGKTPNEFIVHTKKGRKTLTFSCDFRAELLTDVQRFRHVFTSNTTKPALATYRARKIHWSEARREVQLTVYPEGLAQLDGRSGKVLCTYDYKDISSFATISDIPGGVVLYYGGVGRAHAFILENPADMTKKVSDAALLYIGLPLRGQGKSVTYEEFQLNRLGRFSSDESITSITEFICQKFSTRHDEPQSRLVCVTEVCLVERDPATYSVVTVRDFNDIFAFVRDEEDLQGLSIEYKNGDVRVYHSTERDSLLAAVLDAARTAGNRDAFIKMNNTNRGHRIGPLYAPVDEDVESLWLKTIISGASGQGSGAAGDKTSAGALLVRFNTNIGYSGLRHTRTSEGLFAENKERLITSALQALMALSQTVADSDVSTLVEMFEATRRLVSCKTGFEGFTMLTGCREAIGRMVMRGFKTQSEGAAYSAVDMLGALMQPMHDNYDLAQESDNKRSLLSSKSFLTNLVDRLAHYAKTGTGALVTVALLDFLTFALCPPYAETTDAEQFDNLLETVAHLGRVLFRLFQHPSMAIVKAAGLVMQALIEEGDEETGRRMQALALSEGALLRHFITAAFTRSQDTRMLAHRELSRHLVGLWAAGNVNASRLLQRMLPAGLIGFLELDIDEHPVPQDESVKYSQRDTLKTAVALTEAKRSVFAHWRSKIGFKRKEDKNLNRPVTLRRRRQRVKKEGHWALFFYHIARDHNRTDLIWNSKTREELRDACEAELRAFHVDRDLRNDEVIAWNHVEFVVTYPSLAEELKIGDHYVRLLLEFGAQREEIHEPVVFFNDLYHRFLLASTDTMRSLCLQAMASVYTTCFDEIGTFNDMPAITAMLARAPSKMQRDRLVLFIEALLLDENNVRLFIDANGMRQMIDLMTVAHLHVDRELTPLQQNVIEAGADMLREEEREWYYTDPQEQRAGPFNLTEMRGLYDSGTIRDATRCWAQGMGAWRPLDTIPLLKWTLTPAGEQSGVLNETALARAALDVLIRVSSHYPSRDLEGAIIRPLPRCKRALSDMSQLPHLVNVLLTFAPPLVERVASLLTLIMEDNPDLPRLYTTGAFYFALMYTGSNIVPISKFLESAHMKQAHRQDEESAQSSRSRSILAPLLPQAMVCFLEHHGAAKFSEIFLGEFDTPEAIWNAEMRRMMIEKIAVHLADFSPRLQGNPRALYQYCPIPRINYPQLENELFCNVYYLRHLCDETKFPDWPIRDPLDLLKSLLQEWKNEVEKKPPGITSNDALETLGLEPGSSPTDAVIRKAYFKLATKYHPDKNPDGRDMFEKINGAYEFLSARAAQSVVDGPDPRRILLLLRAQSILFRRYAADLEPYKYSGYPMLIKTIQYEANDEQLFSKDTPLLPAAAELAYYTMRVSALNAEELHREGGIDVLTDAFERCVSVVGQETTEEETNARICVHLIRCFTTSARFETCRDKLAQLPIVAREVARCLTIPKAPVLSRTAAECVSAFAIDPRLQEAVVAAGALWHLVPPLFEYDYTLTEAGVETSAETNTQEAKNERARVCLYACARLGGFLSEEEASPENQLVRRSMAALLTPYLASKLRDNSPEETLKLITSNAENPHLIWNNGTRAELLEYVVRQRDNISRGEHDPQAAPSFVFAQLRDELKIGGVYVRVYNSQPAFVLHDANRFVRSTIGWLEKASAAVKGPAAAPKPVTYVEPPKKDEDKLDEEEVEEEKEGEEKEEKEEGEGVEATAAAAEEEEEEEEKEMSTEDDKAASKPAASVGTERSKVLECMRQTLQALRHCFMNNPGTEVHTVQRMPLMFSLLSLSENEAVQLRALECILCISGSAQCLQGMATSLSVIPHLTLLMATVPASHETALNTLIALASVSKLVSELLLRGAVLFTLDVFCNSPKQQIRLLAAQTIGKLTGDKLVGPRIVLFVNKILPQIFVDSMRDNAEASVNMFDTSHENPELIWNDDARDKVCAEVSRLRAQFAEKQATNMGAKFALPEDFSVIYEDLDGEVCVAGVYLRLFLAQPGWALRSPRIFLNALIEKFVAAAGKDASTPGGIENADDQFQLLGGSLVHLLRQQKQLAEQVASIGVIPKLLGAAKKCQSSAARRASADVLHTLSENASCVDGMVAAKLIPSLLIVVDSTPEAVGVVAETIKRSVGLANPQKTNIVKQALDSKAVPKLLDLLSRPAFPGVENISGVKAHIVQAIKAMTNDLEYGAEVTALLEGNAVWAQYKDQKHDLFITKTSIAGYLTGPTSGPVGYLTAGPSSTLSSKPAASQNEPPPIEKDDE